jgi:flagellar biosynthesis protein FliR
MVSVSDTQMLTWLAAVLVPLFRVLGVFVSAPVLSNRAFPMRARVAAGLAITVCIAPQIELPAQWHLGVSNAVFVLIGELVIGLAIGLVARLVFAAFEFAGEIIGLQLGLSFAAFFDPTIGAANPMTRIIHTLALLTFVVLNGPQMLIAAVVHSYGVMPVAAEGINAAKAISIVQAGSSIFSTGLMIAMPFIALLLVINLVLGVVSRIAPQMNIFAVGFPITIAAGLVLVAIGIPLLEAPLTALTQTMFDVLLK